MARSGGPAQLSTPPEPRRSGPGIRLVVLGMTAAILVWTGHDVGWGLLGRAGGFWLLDSAALLAVVATVAGVLRAVTGHWLVAAVAAGLLLALLH
jgi:hypothetical protein